MKKFILIVFVLISTLSYSQRKDWNLGIFAKPSDQYRVKIDGELQKPGYSFLIKPGYHEIQVWSPNYQVYDTAFTYMTGKVIIKIDLQPSAQLKAVRKAQYEKGRLHGHAFIGATSAIVLGIAAAINYNEIGARNLEYVRSNQAVRLNIEGFSTDDRNEDERRLQNSRIAQYTMYGLIAGSLTYCTWKLIKARQVEVPELGDDKSFVLDGVGLSPNRMGGMNASLRLKF